METANPDGEKSMVATDEPVSVTLSPRGFTKPCEMKKSYASWKLSTLMLIAVRSCGDPGFYSSQTLLHYLSSKFHFLFHTDNTYRPARG